MPSGVNETTEVERGEEKNTIDTMGQVLLAVILLEERERRKENGVQSTASLTPMMKQSL